MNVKFKRSMKSITTTLLLVFMFPSVVFAEDKGPKADTVITKTAKSLFMQKIRQIWRIFKTTTSIK